MKTRYTHQQAAPNGVVVQHDYAHSAPMNKLDRILAYERQNGTRRCLTVRQERAIRKAELRDIRHYAGRKNKPKPKPQKPKRPKGGSKSDD